MIITCTSCGRRYNFDPSKLGGRREASVRCSSCQSVIKVTVPEDESSIPAAPAGATRPGALAPAPAPAAGGGGAETAAEAGDRTSRLPADAALLAAPGHVEKGPLQMPAGRRVSLAVLDGPDLGRIYRVESPSVTIGRGEAEVHLEDGEVSRQHARLEMRGGRAVVRDLGSTNGTFVDDVKVAEAEIEDRGEFRVGQTRLMLIMAREGESS